MVRRCCIENCDETDLTILAHRFPKGQQIALQWQNELKLNSIPLEILRQNFVVCTKHFSSKAYRNAISNSLNTTALPSFKTHDDNERIKTTRIKYKSNNVPIRCHKSPNTVLNLPKTISSEEEAKPVKKLKLDINSFDDNEHLIKANIHKTEDTAIKLDTTIINDGEIYDELSYDLYHKHDANEQITLLPDQKSISIQTEIDQVDKEIQTNELEAPSKEVSSADAKDDKLINLLYPDYGGKSKIELIKMIIEKSQKIKSLEEEKQLIEDAMRKLL